MSAFYHVQLSLFPSTKPTQQELETLYLTQRQTTRQIATLFGVSHTSVKRWLQSYRIPARPSGGRGNSPEYQGIESPTLEILHRLVHIEHRGYREIATMYGVSATAVEHWLRKHHIELPTVWETRRKGVQIIYPTQEELHYMYIEQGMTLAKIADIYKVSQAPIADLCRKFGIPLRPDGFNGGIRFTCDDGHLVRSTYEQKVDNWLHENGIAHEYEPRLPFDRRWYADFLANGWYIEVWGVNNSQEYMQRKARKLALYQTHQIPLIQLTIDSFQPRRKDDWERRLTRCLTLVKSQIEID